MHTIETEAPARDGLRYGSREIDALAWEAVFGSDAESIVRDWCKRSGIDFAGRAEIGHDAANRVVPFK